MLAYVRYDKAKFQYDLTNQYFRASVTPGRTVWVWVWVLWVLDREGTEFLENPALSLTGLKLRSTTQAVTLRVAAKISLSLIFE